MDKHILIVEDSPTQSLLLENVLEDAGYQVNASANGLAAVEYLKFNVPNLVISDVIMPEMNGYQLCQAIRIDEKLKNIPILLLTSLADEGQVIAGLESGADAFITKPYDKERLLKKVEALLTSDEQSDAAGEGGDPEVIFSGKKYRIHSNRSRILRYLISTYDSILQLNVRLADSEAKLLNLNTILEEKVQTRTASLTLEVEQRKDAQHTVQITKDEAREARESREYAESVIDTIREPLIVLDQDLRVVTVSRSFYEVFKVNPEETVGQLIYDLGNKQWDIPQLRELLETILPRKASFDNYEVEHDFTTIGRRIMLLNARQIQRVSGKERIILLAIEDITERREIENGLEKARKELETTKISEDAAREYSESIINTVRESLIALDQDLRVVSVSRSFYEVFKVNPEETVGQLIYDLGNKQWDIPKLRELLETILPQKASFENYEVEHDFANIGKRIMLLNARQIQRASGKERIILLAIEDITIRRELEEAHSRLAAIVESADDAIIVEDLDGKIISWNKGAETTYGYTAEEIIGKTTDVIMPPGDPDINKIGIAKIVRGVGIKHFETKRRRKDGQIIDVSLTRSPVKNSAGTIISASTIARDITARKEIENGLEKTRKELEIIKKTADEASEFAESIINTVREPLISLDQNLRVVTVSRSFYDVFKVNPEDTVGQLIFDLGNKQWNIPRLRELLETILPQEASFDNYEVEHDFTNIGRRIMLLNARQIQRASGKERIILLAIEDITERKEIEYGLETAHQDLENLTAELKRVAKVKSEFLANMSHELRTPLNSINGFSEVLYDETFGALNDKQKKYVNNVLTSGKHLLLLINQILDMAKVESGKMKLALTNVPIKTILNEIVLLVEDLAGKKNIQIQLEIAEDLPVIEADELKIKEVIYNLLSNAVKFTPDGGKIGMKASKQDSEIEVTVWDTGVGIALENMDKIFEGFFRVDTPYSRLTEGTGLGLPLSKKMVELHGGKFYVYSEGLDKGTSVRFTLPILSGKEA
ncbi:MAG: PAS domain S-box protein [Treponemataceae bacterium]